MPFIEIHRAPDYAAVLNAGQYKPLQPSGANCFAGEAVAVSLEHAASRTSIRIAANGAALERIHLRWHGKFHEQTRFLGDAWERGYGDLEWRHFVPERPMPWYFLALDDRSTHGYGVLTNPAAMCFWTVDPEGVSLWLDVRNGGGPVQLGDRELLAATIATRRGRPDDSPFESACTFCRQLCPQPRLPSHPVYGINNWYYAYGQHCTAAQILIDTQLLAELTAGNVNRPYSVIDDGWEINRFVTGPWDRGHADFPDLPGLAAQIKTAGVRPGIWIRPLATMDHVPPTWQLQDHADKRPVNPKDKFLDPTIPEVQALISTDIKRLRDWGYQLIKHDFTTYDLLGRWGPQMGPSVTPDGWHFSDRSRTTAEIVRSLYELIRNAAGTEPEAPVIIGCNTIGHLGAGLFELQRTGDDTSGRQWERTRKMGINTLAFRACQHDAFFHVDADCVGITPGIPWDLNRQFLHLLAHSGTPLFVSINGSEATAEHRAALRKAFLIAAEKRPVAEPLDWLQTISPQRWRLGEGLQTYQWLPEAGAFPFAG